MSKPILGILLGAVIGFFDGLTSLFTPEASQYLSIATWSSAKGIIVGLIIGIYARKVDNLSKVVILGLAVALFFAFLVALGQYFGAGQHYWMEIMLPGTITGGLIGYGVHKLGRRPEIVSKTE